MTNEIWKWYSGSTDEQFQHGPFDTREAAVAALDGYYGFVIEAQKTPLQLSEHFDARDFIDLAEDNVYDLCNENGDIIFDVSNKAATDLQTAVRAAIDQWQHQNNLVFEPWVFTQTRNLERVNGEVDDT